MLWTRRRLGFAFTVSLIALSSSLATAQQPRVASDLKLTLPEQATLAVGVEWSVYFDNIVLTQSPDDFQYDVDCDIGKTDSRRWSVTPSAKQVGDHMFTVQVTDSAGKVVAASTMQLRVSPPLSDQSESLKILFVGDSLTHASRYPNEVARLLLQAPLTDWKMLGTHRPASAEEKVAHEGYGGWTWQRFAEKYEPEPDGTHRKRSSPFVFLTDGKPKLDVAKYFDSRCDGERPDVAFFLLGINDCFGANPESAVAIDDRITSMLQHADRVLDEFRRSAPDADLAICLTPPPNSRESGFEANYKGRYHRWGWKRIQHRIVQRLITHYGGREEEGVFVVPTQLNLDPVDGYPENNGVHPNPLGYRQIGATIYGWLCYRAGRASG